MKKFSEVLEAFNTYLPAQIVKVQLLGEQLIIEGDLLTMVFSTSWWRIVYNGVLLFAYEEYNDSKIKQIEGLNIQKVVAQSQFLKSDLTLILSNGYILETFSTNSLEPWSIKIKEQTYYSDPSNEHWTK